MRARAGLLSIGGAIVLTVGGSAAYAAVAGGPVDSSGVVHGCYTNAEVNGSHVFVLQDSGTTCPKGTTAVSWSQSGPAGSTGPAGPAGPVGPAGEMGATGIAGAQGPAGPIGPAGAGVVTSVGVPTSSPCANGDTDVDLADGEVYTCTASAWVDSTQSIQGPAGATGAIGATGATGPKGPAGATGATGPQGPAGAGGIACTTDGGAPGSVSWISTGGSNSVTLTCAALTTDANCAHSDGLGDTYTDCNDLLGTPGDASTYNQPMGADAEGAWAAGNPAPAGDTYFLSGQNDGTCGDVVTLVIDSGSEEVGSIWWYYSGTETGNVFLFGAGAADTLDLCGYTAGVPATTTSTWT